MRDVKWRHGKISVDIAATRRYTPEGAGYKTETHRAVAVDFWPWPQGRPGDRYILSPAEARALAAQLTSYASDIIRQQEMEQYNMEAQ